jgi:hypothetical protein
MKNMLKERCWTLYVSIEVKRCPVDVVFLKAEA